MSALMDMADAVTSAEGPQTTGADIATDRVEWKIAGWPGRVAEIKALRSEPEALPLVQRSDSRLQSRKHPLHLMADAFAKFIAVLIQRGEANTIDRGQGVIARQSELDDRSQGDDLGRDGSGGHLADHLPQGRQLFIGVGHSNLSVVLQSGDDGESLGGAMLRPAMSATSVHVRAAEDCQ